jgi:NitT/TauT family transport system permease protein
LIVVAVLLGIWNWLPVWLGMSQFELPTLSEDLAALGQSWGTIGTGLEVTVADALVGFTLGNILAIVGAVIFSQSKYIEWAFYPVAILVQTIPIIVIAPVMVIVLASVEQTFPGGPAVWDPGNSLPIIGVGTKPILAVTMLITFFPTLVNMTVGLRAVDPNLFALMRLINASRWTVLWRLRLPSSMPYLFSSFKITSTLCFVGAVVGEWMLPSGNGIGALFSVYSADVQHSAMWACVIVVSLASLVFFTLVVIAEKLLVPWRQEH